MSPFPDGLGAINTCIKLQSSSFPATSKGVNLSDLNVDHNTGYTSFTADCG